MRSHRTLTLLLPFALFANEALAQTEAKKTAVELVKLIITPATYKDMLQQMTDNMLPAMRAQAPNLPPDIATKLVAAVEDALPYDELVGWTADVYASKFSVPELKDLIAFYKSPVGRKLARIMPELMGESGKKMGELLPVRLPAAMKKQGIGP